MGNGLFLWIFIFLNNKIGVENYTEIGICSQVWDQASRVGSTKLLCQSIVSITSLIQTASGTKRFSEEG